MLLHVPGLEHAEEKRGGHAADQSAHDQYPEVPGELDGAAGRVHHAKDKRHLLPAELVCERTRECSKGGAGGEPREEQQRDLALLEAIGRIQTIDVRTLKPIAYIVGT